ncbi:MAG: hypothetical protein JSU06_11520 [Actinobacteria bacterium]|nr:hypothetical protein [Actinomycetota bacterium]
MVQPDALTAGIRLVRAEEAWESVLFAGLIPIGGAVAVGGLIWRAVKDPPEHNRDLPPEDEPLPPPGPEDDGHEGPLS